MTLPVGAGVRRWSSPSTARCRAAACTAGGQVRGFALGATKVVLDGDVGRMVELARANVRNIPRPSLTR